MIKNKIRILIADDSMITRQGWEFVLNKVKDIEVVATAKSLVEVKKKTKKIKPNI